MTKPILSEEEIATLKSARKILKVLTKKHWKLLDILDESDDDKSIIYNHAVLDRFENFIYKHAKVDFLDEWGAKAFIEL